MIGTAGDIRLQRLAVNHAQGQQSDGQQNKAGCLTKHALAAEADPDNPGSSIVVLTKMLEARWLCADQTSLVSAL